MVDLNGSIEATKVCNNGNAEGAYAAMMGYNNFRHGGHTYGVATEQTVHAVLCGGLEGGTLDPYIDTVLHRDVFLGSNLVSQLDELVVIGLVHIREAWPSREVLATEWMLGEEIDVISDDHEVADMEGGVHASCGIGDEERLHPQFVHNTYREGDFLHGIAFVEMKASLHGDDVHSSEFSENEFAGMSLNGGQWEVWNVLVGILSLFGYFGN